MMTSSAMKDANRHTPVRINYSKARQKYAKGGLAKEAENVRQSGRMGDDMVVHVNKREFDEMCQRWGDPTINPDTKMPEFFLGDLFSGIGNLVTSGSSYIPVVGDSISGYLQSSPGVAQAIGTGALGALGGQLLGGNTRSTLLGGALGAVAPSIYGLFAGGSGTGGGAGFSDASVPGVAARDIPMEQAAQDFAKNGGGGASLLSKFSNLPADKKIMAAAIGAMALGSLGQQSRNQGGGAAAKAAALREKESQAQFNKPMPTFGFDRTYTAPPPGFDPKLYGFGGQDGMNTFYANNRIPQRQSPMQAANGGPVQGYAKGGPMGALSAMHVSGESAPHVRGPGGAREDKIPALLSNNEYVFDAETTALLGDGDAAMGAKKLDAMRANIRKHKGGALAKGKISPDAKAPEHYMRAR